MSETKDPRILVIQLKRIGDLILTTPLVEALRRQFPRSEISLLVSAECRQILPAIGSVDKFHVYDRNGGNAILWLRLAVSVYDICIDCTGNDRSCLSAMLSKAARKINFDRNRNSQLRRAVYNEWAESSVRNRHTIDHYLDLLKPLKIPVPENPEPALSLPADAERRANEIISEHHLENGFAIIHPGSARKEKFWLPDRWAEVAGHLHRRHGMAIVFTGANGNPESAHLCDLTCGMDIPFTNLAGEIDLPTLAALIRACRLLLTVDSAPVHIASAFRKPQIALYGPTNPFHWHGRYPEAVALIAGDSGNKFLPKHEKAEMSILSTMRVIDAIDKLIN